jgi:hypothetical protein
MEDYGYVGSSELQYCEMECRYVINFVADASPFRSVVPGLPSHRG